MINRVYNDYVQYIYFFLQYNLIHTVCIWRGGELHGEMICPWKKTTNIDFLKADTSEESKSEEIELAVRLEREQEEELEDLKQRLVL